MGPHLSTPPGEPPGREPLPGHLARRPAAERPGNRLPPSLPLSTALTPPGWEAAWSRPSSSHWHCPLCPFSACAWWVDASPGPQRAMALPGSPVTTWLHPWLLGWDLPRPRQWEQHLSGQASLGACQWGTAPLQEGGGWRWQQPGSLPSPAQKAGSGGAGQPDQGREMLLLLQHREGSRGGDRACFSDQHRLTAPSRHAGAVVTAGHSEPHMLLDSPPGGDGPVPLGRIVPAVAGAYLPSAGPSPNWPWCPEAVSGERLGPSGHITIGPLGPSCSQPWKPSPVAWSSPQGLWGHRATRLAPRGRAHCTRDKLSLDVHQ